MGLALRDDMILEPREDEGAAVLRPRPGRGFDRPAFHLPPVQGLALSLLDGTRTLEEVADLLGAVFERSPADVAGLVDYVVDRYRLFLVEADPNRAPSDDRARQSPEAFLFHSERAFSTTREAAPRSLSWVVTEWCTKRCIYCYKDAHFSDGAPPRDSSLPLRRVVELAIEACRIGVDNLVLTGGEPFLRPDLIDVIAAFETRDVRVIPITKARIEGRRMKDLAATGLGELHVSLDSPRETVQDSLCGVPGAFRDIVATLRCAGDEGLPTVLRPVITSHTLRDLPLLVELVRDLGVRRVLIDLYGESQGRGTESLGVSSDDVLWLRRCRDELAERYPEVSLELKFDERTRSGKPPGCKEGFRGLTMLPDGRATKCEHWRSGDDLIVGDLRVQSILDVWDSPALANINHAPRERFAGTPCYRCKRFDTCNELRGRCSASVLDARGTPFGPDVYCPIGAFRQGAANREAVC